MGTLWAQLLLQFSTNCFETLHVNLVSFFTWNVYFKVYRQWVPCGRNSSYSFPSIVFKLCRCFWHGMEMCMWFGYNTLIIFSYFFCYVNLVSFLREMLSKCIDSRYIVGASPLTVFHRMFWNFADVFCMERRCACGFDNFFSLFLLCELSLFFYMKCYQSV